MSTEIKEIVGRHEINRSFGTGQKYEKSIITIARFFGGRFKGTMLQLTIDQEHMQMHIQLTKRQVKNLIKVLKNAFDYDKYPNN